MRQDKLLTVQNFPSLFIKLVYRLPVFSELSGKRSVRKILSDPRELHCANSNAQIYATLSSAVPVNKIIPPANRTMQVVSTAKQPS